MMMERERESRVQVESAGEALSETVCECTALEHYYR